MNVNEVLQFVDRLVVEKTGKHLDDIQKAVVEGTLQRQTYDDIAQKCHVTKNHVGDVGAELWKLVSEALGEDIKKTNFRSTFERLDISLSQSSQNICNVGNSQCNFGSQILYNSTQNNQENSANNKSKSVYHDLTLAPQIINFYNRETELKTLSNWIFKPNTRLISILGLFGIGKTALVKRWVDLNLDQFEVIIWRSLKYPKPLELLVKDLLNIIKPEDKQTIDDQVKQLLDILINKKCLIILDDVQNIFTPGQFAGQYQPEYQSYQNFFTLITETEHQSSLILIGQEKCPEMEGWENELYPINCLELSGLYDLEILNNKGLKNDEFWLNLINLYEGNPVYLKSIAILIKNIFDGDVAEFLAENELVITQEMRSQFNQLFHRLSPIEQQIVLKLSEFEQPLSRETLRESVELSSTDLINGLQSLQQRYLVTKIKQDKIMFKLSSIFGKYVKNFNLD
ncbi:ATP-binding protein [Planktothrix agardhii 1806]|uniref:AAA family ATPase n=1 Tax=Planktothrix agardhii TaxID=1160 RepID=UPI001F4309C4|nr:AAA family ATPase [Planktothrix agardhii]MCF3570958.1 ATP-binding protein [Planktothrix agardhii 1805]MCF3587230.1 ATP-binding protein [Planktothrix agardhii 1803]MCF3602822.1 ATP-binding protein [Planktothrix agardhii 1804]MCF3616266.1 ATP-binding protein [Planktothrix agardhii 1806]